MKWFPILLLAALPANAAVFEVTRTFDSQDGVCDRDCSLREAISAANAQPGVDVVIIPAGIYRLDAGDLDIEDGAILVGAGPGSTVLSGGGSDRVLDVHAPAEVFGVTIRDGRTDGDGGGILVRASFSASLLLHRSVVTANRAGGDGGGIAIQGLAEIRDSAILDNQAGGDGGGIAGGTEGSFSLYSVTVSGNRADGSGGGLDYPADRIGIVSGSTVAFNQAGASGGGLFVRPRVFPGFFEDHVQGSIVAENFAPAEPDCNRPVSMGYNVLGASCQPGARDRTGAIGQVLFRVPSYELGPTPVHEPLLNSPALDFVELCEPADQVGQARQVPCDAGAREEGGRQVCVPGGAVLCLQDGRFRVSASFGSNLPAAALPLTDDTGNYWFFAPENLEVMVKVLNGCGVNGRWWVFSSGLTNVGVTLRVEDLETGRVRETVQPPGQTYLPRLDTAAFPCGQALKSEAAGALSDPPTSVLVVTKTEDTFDGSCNHDCSLREAVAASNVKPGTGVIVLGPGVYGLTLQGAHEEQSATGDLDVTGDLVILGAGARRTVLEAQNVDRVLEVKQIGSLDLRDATVTHGSPPEPSAGGGIQALGPLTLVRTLVTENFSDAGGGIFSTGSVTMRDSTVSNNDSLGSGGGISADGADLENVTVSGNLAAGHGGGLHLGEGPSVLRHVTVTGNRAIVGGGVDVVVSECPVPFCDPLSTIERTVIAGNVGSDCGNLPPYDGELNVLGAGCGAGTVDPKLSPLGDNGGPTPTHLPLPDSPAIDIAPICLGPDQRGRLRLAGRCDAGAVERLPGCQPDPETLCLGTLDRFRVTARWTTATDSGPAKSLPLTGDTGSFWFFDPANVELTVKILYGCGVNERYWVFLSGLTDVGVEVRVEDTKTGETWIHQHAAGTPLQPRLDTDALEVCP